MSFDIGKTIQCDHIDYTGKFWGEQDASGKYIKISGCPKCLGRGYYYDLEWNSADGNVTQVEDLELLQELCVKAILTKIKSNKFHPEYGTSIYDAIATVSSTDYMARLLETEIEKAFGYLRYRQEMQLQVGQEMSDDELIYSVPHIDFQFIDERTLKVIMDIVAESGKDITFEI